MLSTNRTFKYFQELFPWCSNKGRLSAWLFLVPTGCTELGNAVAQAYIRQPYNHSTGICWTNSLWIVCKATASEQARPASQKSPVMGWIEKGKCPCVDQTMMHDIKKRSTKSGSLSTKIAILKLNVSWTSSHLRSLPFFIEIGNKRRSKVCG